MPNGWTTEGGSAPVYNSLPNWIHTVLHLVRRSLYTVYGLTAPAISVSKTTSWREMQCVAPSPMVCWRLPS